MSNKLADPIWRTYEALRAQQVQESESLHQGKACFRSGLTSQITVQPSVTEIHRDSTETRIIPLLVPSGNSNWIGLN